MLFVGYKTPKNYHALTTINPFITVVVFTYLDDAVLNRFYEWPKEDLKLWFSFGTQKALKNILQLSPTTKVSNFTIIFDHLGEAFSKIRPILTVTYKRHFFALL